MLTPTSEPQDVAVLSPSSSAVFTEGADPEAMLRHLQHLLRLEDWDIDLFIINHESDEWGVCQWWGQEGRAKITLVAPHQHPSWQHFVETFIHEMLHLRFSHLPEEEHEASELAINRLSTVLARSALRPA